MEEAEGEDEDGGAAAAAADAAKEADDVVDADFEEVKDDDKKS
jgi:molecular chaperone DnaK